MAHNAAAMAAVAVVERARGKNPALVDSASANQTAMENSVEVTAAAVAVEHVLAINRASTTSASVHHSVKASSAAVMAVEVLAAPARQVKVVPHRAHVSAFRIVQVRSVVETVVAEVVGAAAQA